MQSAISQGQKDEHCILSHVASKKAKTHRSRESRDCQGWQEGNRERSERKKVIEPFGPRVQSLC